MSLLSRLRRLVLLVLLFTAALLGRREPRVAFLAPEGVGEISASFSVISATLIFSA